MLVCRSVEKFAWFRQDPGSSTHCSLSKGVTEHLKCINTRGKKGRIASTNVLLNDLQALEGIPTVVDNEASEWADWVLNQN